MKKKAFDDLALLLRVLLGFALAGLLYLSPWFISNVQDYETLVTGLIAATLTLGGAFATVWVINRQIRQQQDMEDERRSRREYAARAMMPHALRSLCEYAENCCEELRKVTDGNLLPNNPDTIVFPDNFRVPDIPKTSLEPLYLLLQFGREDIQRYLAELMQFLQIQQSRIHMHSIEPNQTFGYQYYSRLVEALEIHARASALFSFARGNCDTAPDIPSKDRMHSSADRCRFSPGWSKLREHIDERWRPYKSI